MKKQKALKLIHIAIIILGIIFIFNPAFHKSLWFDESYSVGIANKGFADIWKIIGNDVHPALYYWMLHIVYLIFGSNILMYRLFSVLAIAILGILGYTHIRKDFGEKTGILFSFFTYFLPIMNTYAEELRMYSWSCLIVTLMAIYGYRFYKNIKDRQEKGKLKNLILFGIFSICCCYIHYYALVTTCLVNLLLLIYLIRNRKEEKKTLIRFLILAAIQIVLYIPWLIYFMGQLRHVGGGFWISLGWPNTPVEVLSVQFRRQLDTVFSFDLMTILALVVAILIYIYIGRKIYKLKKENKDLTPVILSLAVYLGVIGIILIISIVMPLLYSRYLVVITGLYIFTLAFVIAKEENKNIILLICAVVLALGIKSNIDNVNFNYYPENLKVYDYIDENIQEGDIIVYSNIGNGGVVAAYFPEYEQYFLNFDHWDVEEAYKAYGPGMKTVTDWSFLENYKGRIWLIDSEYMGLYDVFPKENIKVLLDAKRIDTKYHEYIYNIMLLEKE